MRDLLPLAFLALLLLGFPAARAQNPDLAPTDPINCETFSSGFTTPDGCIDGSQPSSGPIPADQWQVGEDGVWPDEGFGPGFLLY